jgi:hypothetical protein
MKLSGYDVYRLYVALKTHFHSETYDFFENEGRIRAKRSSYGKRRDRYFFERLAKRFSGRDSFELMDYFVANLATNADLWVGDMLAESCEQNYMDWCRRIQSLDYTFKCDCEILLNEIEKEDIAFNVLFETESQKHPLLLRMVMRNQISIVSFIILDNMLHFFKRWDREMPGDYVWESFRRRCQKYKPFLTDIDANKYKHSLAMKSKLQERGLLA